MPSGSAAGAEESTHPVKRARETSTDSTVQKLEEKNRQLIYQNEQLKRENAQLRSLLESTYGQQNFETVFSPGRPLNATHPTHGREQDASFLGALQHVPTFDSHPGDPLHRQRFSFGEMETSQEWMPYSDAFLQWRSTIPSPPPVPSSTRGATVRSGGQQMPDQGRQRRFAQEDSAESDGSLASNHIRLFPLLDESMFAVTRSDSAKSSAAGTVAIKSNEL